MYMKALPIHTLINTSSHPTAAYSRSLPREGVPSPAQPAQPWDNLTSFIAHNHLHEKPEHKQQQTFLRPPIPFHLYELPNLISQGQL